MHVILDDGDELARYLAKGMFINLCYFGFERAMIIKETLEKYTPEFDFYTP